MELMGGFGDNVGWKGNEVLEVSKGDKGLATLGQRDKHPRHPSL